MKRKVNIKNDEWLINLDIDNQLSLSYIVPIEKSSYKDNPLWFTFDENDSANDIEYSYSLNGVSKLSPFLIKKEIIWNIAELIKISKVNFFYFKTKDKQRGNIYSLLINYIKSKLGDWDCQNVNNEYFYFTKK